MGGGRLQLLETYRRLPIARRRGYFQEILDEVRDGGRVIPFEEILRDPTVLEEAERLACGAGLDVRELAQVVNPFQDTSPSALSRRCTMVRLPGSQAREESGVDVNVDVCGDIYIWAHGEIEFRHRIIPASFDLHVLAGALEIVRENTITPLERGCVAAVAAGAETLLRAGPGARFLYVDHPLTAWIRQRTQQR